MKQFVFSAVVLILSLTNSKVNGQRLRWVVTASKLPASPWFGSALYDETAGAIYVIGGDNNNAGVFKYNIATDTIEENGQFRGLQAGVAVLATTGEQLPFTKDIYYLGGVNLRFNPNVTRYSPILGQFTDINTLPSGQGMSQMSSAFNHKSQTLYTFGGFDGRYLDTILKYNVATNDVQQVGQLPDALYGATAAFADNNDLVYIFGGNNGSVNTQNAFDIHVFDPTTAMATKLATRLPTYVFNACAAYVESNVYIFHHSGLLRFNVATGQVQVVEIEQDTWAPYLHGAACVYVPNLHRIYLFGGSGNFNGNDIAYVDLSE